MKTSTRIVSPLKPINLVLLNSNEVFNLDDKFYRTPDESFIIKSTQATGQLFRPTNTDSNRKENE